MHAQAHTQFFMKFMVMNASRDTRLVRFRYVNNFHDEFDHWVIEVFVVVDVEKVITETAEEKFIFSARSSQGQPGAARSSQEQPGAARGSQEQPGAARGSQEQP